MSNSSIPKGFPQDIPIAKATFENWSQMISVRDVWTCAPKRAEDVVRVCNWAAGAGFRVRARGIMHGWSPLTVTDADDEKVVLVDMTELKTIKRPTPATGDEPAQVVVETGAAMDALMNVLEYSDVGGPDLGFGFPHIPAPGHITVGGALAIDAHGTGVPTLPNDALPGSYGSLSNQVLAFTAVVTLPGSDNYVAHTFTRGDSDAKAFLTHCGRALLLDATLEIVENYNLRCQSSFASPARLFAAPTGNTPPPGSVGDYLNASGRIEVIWFPFSDNPWMKVWTVAPTKPAEAVEVWSPYNYEFSDHLPTWITGLLKQVISGTPSSPPISVGRLQGSRP